MAALGFVACSNSFNDSESTESNLSEPTKDIEAAVAATELLESIIELESAVAATREQLERLQDFDELENLVGIYGYYADQSMQDDITDLFAETGMIESLGRGVFYGQNRVREYTKIDITGSRNGVLRNHVHIQPVIHINPDGNRARIRSRFLDMHGIENTSAQWGAGIYENEFIKQDGIWKIDYLHAYQTFYSHYEDGWAKLSSGIFSPLDELPPDQHQSVDYAPYPAAFVPPFHYLNPVTGREDFFGQPRPTLEPTAPGSNMRSSGELNAPTP